MNKLKHTVRDIRYERVCRGTRYAENDYGSYLELYEVEERITRKIGWYVGSVSGGGNFPIQHHDSTKVFELSKDALIAGLELPTRDPWKLIIKNGESILCEEIRRGRCT